jgi:hypothetical protein
VFFPTNDLGRDSRPVGRVAVDADGPLRELAPGRASGAAGRGVRESTSQHNGREKNGHLVVHNDLSGKGDSGQRGRAESSTPQLLEPGDEAYLARIRSRQPNAAIAAIDVDGF